MIYLLIGIAVLTVLIDYIFNDNKNDRGVIKNNKYPISLYQKKSIMTQTEKKFYDMFRNILDEKYLVIPQVNLAAIINKKNDNYHNELFRNIDFGIYDKNTFELLLLIEINDESHNYNYKTKERDYKVDSICNSVGYKLIKFWTNKPNEYSYVKSKLHEMLDIKENINSIESEPNTQKHSSFNQ